MVSPPRPAHSESPTAPPWSPLSVVLIAFVLPAGGAILTVRNLQRLDQIAGVRARWMMVLTVSVFVLGQAILLALAKPGVNGVPQVDADVQTVLAFGVALASFVAQRGPFRSWRAAHEEGTSSWLRALGLAVLYQVGIMLAVYPIYALVTVMATGTVG